MMGPMLEYYRLMLALIPKEVAQTKFVRTSILYSPIFKGVGQFKIMTIQFEQNVVDSYARVDFCIFFCSE
jgi:hypothetical protein